MKMMSKNFAIATPKTTAAQLNYPNQTVVFWRYLITAPYYTSDLTSSAIELWYFFLSIPSSHKQVPHGFYRRLTQFEMANSHPRNQFSPAFTEPLIHPGTRQIITILYGFHSMVGLPTWTGLM